MPTTAHSSTHPPPHTDRRRQVGVKTPLANVVTAVFMTLILVVATGLLKFVPKAVLGAIICTCIMNLFDFHDMWRCVRARVCMPCVHAMRVSHARVGVDAFALSLCARLATHAI
jgi:hypothetical protein